MLRKTLIAMLLMVVSTISMAASNVSIPVPGSAIVAPKHGEIRISYQDLLYKDVTWAVSCELYNPSQETLLSRFDVNGRGCLGGPGCGTITVNGRYSTSTIKLAPGLNTVTMNDVNPYIHAQEIIFINLDNDNTFSIKSCTANITG